VHPDADGNPTISVFDNGFQAPSGSKALAAVPHSSDVVTALYLIGSPDDDSLGWLSQRLDTASGTTPVGVPTGQRRRPRAVVAPTRVARRRRSCAVP
jgi:hypothetical protein